MRIYIVIAIFFSVTTIILSQENSSCGTKVPLGISPEQVKSNNLHLFENTNTYNLRLAIHIVYSQNGNDSITNENLYYKLQKLNYYMEQAGFSFYEYNRDYIESDYFANFSEEKTDSLFSTFYIDGCINVYFVPVFADNGRSSFSYRFGVSPQGIVVINSAHETTLPHEMGHYFDLLHTDHIWIIEEIPGVLDSLYENIDRVGNCKNCDFTGDLLCDTPADPSRRMKGSLVNDNCTWNPSRIPPFDECNNNNYAPLTDNLMTTELPRICRNNFTSSQIQRMRQTLIEYRGGLLKNLVYLENSIDGSNAGGNLHIDYNNFPSGSTAIVDSGNHIVGTYNERFNNNNLYKHNSWNQFSQDYYLKRTVYIENNVEQIANFSKLESVTVRNKIDGMNFNDGLNIRFNDPWYVKDQYRNQSGMNDFIPFTSPYFPTGAYNQSSGGVFLNQGITPQGQWQPPYYSVKADYLQTFNLSQTGRTHKFYFQGWSASPQGSAEFQNANALETPVVFNQENATL
jgi:hypothetical protein